MSDRFIVDSDGRPVRGTFPTHWGDPPQGSVERAEWIRSNIAEGEARMDAGEAVEGQRPHTGRQALAVLARKRESPAFANHVRARILELREEGPQ